MNVEPLATNRPHRFTTVADAALAIVVVLHIVLIWLAPRMPTQDGPSHLHNADALLRLSDPESSEFRKFYVINPSPSPNWLGHVILAGLLTSLPPAAAEKVFVSIYAIGFMLAVRYALRSVSASGGALALLATPFILSWHLYMGFYNYCIGLVLWCVGFGYWLRRRGLRSARQVGTFALLCVLLYASHPTALVALGVAIGASGLFGMSLRRAGRGGEPTAPAHSRELTARLLLPLVSTLPALALAVVYGRTGGGGGETRWAPLREVALELATMDPLVALNEAERPIAAAFAACLTIIVVAVAHDRWSRPRTPGASTEVSLYAAAAALLALYFVTPGGIGGCWYVNGRILPFAVLSLLIASGAGPLRPWLARALPIAGCVFTVAFLLVRAPAHLAMGALLAECVAPAPLVTPNATVLSIGFAHGGRDASGRPLSTRVKPFLHLGAAIAAERGAIDLRNYEANTSVFPVRYRPERQPFRAIALDGNMEAEPPRVDFIHYAERTGEHVHYVLLCGVAPQHDHDLNAKGIFKQLAFGYERVFITPRTGFVQLYKLKSPSP